MKKTLTLITVCALILSLAACDPASATPNTSPSAQASASSSFDVGQLNLPDTEQAYVEEALALGIAWDGLFESAEVSSRDMAQLLKNANDKAYGDGRYQVLSFYLANASDTPVTRMDIAQMIFDAHLEYACHLSAQDMNSFNAAKDEALQQENSAWKTTVSLSAKLIRNADGAVVGYDTSSAPDGSEIEAAGDPAAVQFAVTDYDRLTDDKVMRLFDDETFRPNETMGPAEAAGIACRYYHSLEPETVYVPVGDVGTYNENIITADLLKKADTLPAASNAHLPNWKGYNKQFMATMMGVGDEGSMWVTENEIKAIADSGANFLRLWISFAYFEGPDYAGEDQVNTYDIEHLDSIIAWCIDSGMHLQISLVNMPGMDRNTMPEDEKGLTNRIYTDESYRDRCVEWYRMLARRYAALPNNCFSINLLNEPEVSDDATYTEAFRPIVEAIREESPERLIVSDVINNVTGEGMAEMGVALSCHTYGATAFGVATDSNRDYQHMTWPYQYVTGLLYGPEAVEWDGIPESYTQTGDTFSGNVAGTWAVMLNYICNGDARFCVKVDGKTVYDGTPACEPDIEGGTDCHATEPVTFDVPQGSHTVELSCPMYRVGLGSILITREDGSEVSFNAEINWNHSDAPSVVTIGDDGSVTGCHVVDAQAILDNEILPTKALADQYGVGFMVGEMGMYGNMFMNNIIPRGEVQKYYTDITSALNAHGIPWAFGALQGWFTLIMPYPNDDQFTYEKINDAVWVDKDMSAFFSSLFSG